MVELSKSPSRTIGMRIHPHWSNLHVHKRNTVMASTHNGWNTVVKCMHQSHLMRAFLFCRQTFKLMLVAHCLSYKLLTMSCGVVRRGKSRCSRRVAICNHRDFTLSVINLHTSTCLLFATVTHCQHMCKCILQVQGAETSLGVPVQLCKLNQMLSMPSV